LAYQVPRGSSASSVRCSRGETPSPAPRAARDRQQPDPTLPQRPGYPRWASQQDQLQPSNRCGRSAERSSQGHSSAGPRESQRGLATPDRTDKSQRPAPSSRLFGRVEPGRTARPVFPRPPLKFRTVGFPQYGFKRASDRRPSPRRVRLKRRPHTPPAAAYTAASCPGGQTTSSHGRTSTG
jgi:hypothetical protein